MKNLSINDFEKMFGSKITSNQHRTINLISLAGISFAIGMVVDNSLVVWNQPPRKPFLSVRGSATLRQR